MKSQAMMMSLLLSALLLPSATQAADGAIDRVVVYADRAEVSRTARAQCTADKADVVFAGLPTRIDQRTLRAAASGKAKAIGTASRIVALEENRDARVAKLNEELWVLRDAIRANQEKTSGIRERLSSLSAYLDYFRGLLGEMMRNDRVDTGVWGKTLDQARAERMRATDEMHKLSLEQRQLNRNKQKLEKSLANLAPSRISEALTVKVAVDCRGEAAPKVTLSYVVPSSTWKPEYDLRFVASGKGKTGRGKAELTVAAVVQQASGEDWTNVRLSLSTAKPRLGSEAPYPARMTIYGYEAGREKVLVGKMEKRDKLRGAGGGAGPAGPQSAEFADKGQSVQLEMPRRVTVKSDGRPYWMPVDVTTASATAKLVAVPKLRPFVFQAVSFKNPARYPLLAGRVHIYRGGSYVGDTMVEYTASGEPMEMSLGIDEELKVERKDIASRNKKAGMLSSTQHLERAYWIEIANNSSSRQPVEIRENIPVSKDEKVEIELVKDKTTKGFSLDKHRGFITWTLKPGRGQKKVVELHYTIHLPEDWKVQIR